jgi:hypothetical protein
MGTLLYVGSYLDCSPLRLYPEIHDFLYVDQAPENSTCHWGYTEKDGPIYLKNFGRDFQRNLKKMGCCILSAEISDKSWMFTLQLQGKIKTLIYLINTVFPSVESEHLALLLPCTILFVKGYIPLIKDCINLAPQLTTVISNHVLDDLCPKLVLLSHKE